MGWGGEKEVEEELSENAVTVELGVAMVVMVAMGVGGEGVGVLLEQVK